MNTTLADLMKDNDLVKAYEENGMVTQIIVQKGEDIRIYVRTGPSTWTMVRESMIIDYLKLNKLEV